MTTQPTAAGRWSFWFRRNSRQYWEEIAEADSEREAWERLFRYDERGGDRTVCRPDNDPNRPLDM